MSITLKPDMEKLVQEKVRSGAYRSPEEVIQAGLSLLDSRDRKLAALRADLQVGIDQLDRGEVATLDMDALIEGFKARHVPKPTLR